MKAISAGGSDMALIPISPVRSDAMLVVPSPSNKVAPLPPGEPLAPPPLLLSGPPGGGLPPGGFPAGPPDDAQLADLME
eukprot:2057001-Pyramimonas_sp.AAC.1